MLFVTYLEYLGFVSGLACVWLNVRARLEAWYLALVSVLSYAVVFWHSGLYADAGLQIFFAIQSVYGLWQWSNKRPTSASFLRNITHAEYAYYSAFFAGSFGTIYYLLVRHTDTNVGFLDALCTAMSVVAQLMMANKIVQNWVVWLVVDLIYVGLYAYKSLYLTAVLYGVFCLMAWYGWIHWKTLMHSNQSRQYG